MKNKNYANNLEKNLKSSIREVKIINWLKWWRELERKRKTSKNYMYSYTTGIKKWKTIHNSYLWIWILINLLCNLMRLSNRIILNVFKEDISKIVF